MSPADDSPNDVNGEASPEAPDDGARVADKSRGQSSVDRLVRFQIEAYKARIAELKRALAGERAEKRTLTLELAALHERHRALKQLWRQLEAAHGKTLEGEDR